MIHAGELASCAAGVARVAVLLLTLGRPPCARDTAAYCRARAKLPEVVLWRLVRQVGHGLERRVPADWLWHGRHVKLADGTTVTMADTDANQAAYPQQKAQAPGVGFPILRLVVLFSLATACVCGLELAPYRGKLTGETTLLRQMLDLLDEGDMPAAKAISAAGGSSRGANTWWRGRSRNAPRGWTTTPMPPCPRP